MNFSTIESEHNLITSLVCFVENPTYLPNTNRISHQIIYFGYYNVIILRFVKNVTSRSDEILIKIAVVCKLCSIFILDIFLHDEIVFADYLSEFHKQLPNLHSLSCRLKIISLKDPLINSKGEPLTEEMFFR